ncbi:MAG TPA: sigma-70 family RNA polymerase sigma factor [Candidatus Binatia bacterium]|nr:sigma-70 family RNA polymerase sigma factor [Candidatus Binatia bacterium]
MAPDGNPNDEELVGALLAGSEEALGTLYARHAPAVFAAALRRLDRAAAEEIVQDVFLAVWRRAETFDPSRGAFRPWLLQITHRRVLNEIRRRGRRPQLEADPDGARLAAVPDDGPEPAEAAWRAYRRAAVQAAFAALPPRQRQALGLAFFEDLTHAQVAEALEIPLGTAKTRVRTALQALRGRLAPQAAALVLTALLALLAVRWHADRVRLARDDRALSLTTASDAADLRLAPLPGMPAATHARYRGRAGAPIAVVTLSKFPPPPAGMTYQVWARLSGAWTSLGTAVPDAAGSARLIAEGPAFTTLPEAVEVTVEPTGGSPAPRGRVAAAWPPR